MPAAPVRGRRYELMDEPVRVISTVQVGITAIGILIGAVGEPLVVDLLGGAIPEWLGFVIAFAVVTYLSVVLGELVPKALTLDRAETLAVAVARPTRILAIAFRADRVGARGLGSDTAATVRHSRGDGGRGRSVSRRNSAS